MPQLDFREALSTPDEKFFSPAATVSAIAAAVPVDQRAEHFTVGFGFTRSTWANIVFVAIASIGGLVCAFYFFNGGELLRAAASWPSEFLYPRPLSTEKIDIAQLPDAVDQFVRNETSSANTDQAKATSENNAVPSNFSQPATTVGSTNSVATSPVDGGTTVFPPPAPPPRPPPVSLPPTPSLPETPSLPSTPSIPNVVDVPPAPSVDSLLQSLDQTPTSVVTKSTIVRTAKNKSSSTKRKVASTAKKVSTASAAVTARNMQQGANQTQLVNQTQMGGLSHGANQVMTSGGLGGGLSAGSAVGAGAVSGVGPVAGGLGGLGGVNGAGLGGGISGTLGGLGGVLGGKH